MRLILLLFLAFGCAMLGGCRKHRVVSIPTPPSPAPAAASSSSPNTLVPGTAIQSAGTWTNRDLDASQVLDVTVSGRRIEWKRTAVNSPRSGSNSSAITLAKESAPWFIYVETPDSLWFFDGHWNLSYVRWHKSGRDDVMVINAGKLEGPPEEVPAGLIPHLPTEMQKLFPAGSNKRRPSI